MDINIYSTTCTVQSNVLLAQNWEKKNNHARVVKNRKIELSPDVIKYPCDTLHVCSRDCWPNHMKSMSHTSTLDADHMFQVSFTAICQQGCSKDYSVTDRSWPRQVSVEGRQWRGDSFKSVCRWHGNCKNSPISFLTQTCQTSNPWWRSHTPLQTFAGA